MILFHPVQSLRRRQRLHRAGNGKLRDVAERVEVLLGDRVGLEGGGCVRRQDPPGQGGGELASRAEVRESVLRDQRAAYYRHVRQLTENWTRSRK